MATKGELMRAGMPAEQANMLGVDLDATGETATGTTQATAFVIKASITNLSTVGANSGYILPSATGNGICIVMHNGVSNAAAYPAVGEQINQAGANTAFTHTAGKCCIFIAHGNQWFANLSA